MVSACFHVIEQKDERGEQRETCPETEQVATGSSSLDTFAAEETPLSLCPQPQVTFTLVWAEKRLCGCICMDRKTAASGVTSIGVSAFYYCDSLTSVYCEATTPPTGDSSMFGENASDRKIYVPTESVEAYKSASGWSEYADAIVGYDF